MTYVFTDGEQLTAQKVNDYLVNKPFEYRAQRGILIPSGSGGVNLNITYSSPFPDGVLPSIQLTVTHPNITHWRVTNESESGFTARFDRSGAAVYYVSYIALPER